MPTAKRKAMRAAILERAGNCCEGSPAYPDCRAAGGKPHPVTGGRVRLIVTPLNHDPDNQNPENLKALCGRCFQGHTARYRRGVRQFSDADMLRFGSVAWGAIGRRVVAKWREFDDQYFDGALQ